MFLGRGPDEPPDDDLRSFYVRLLRAIDDADLRDGTWRLCECEGWPDNDSRRQLVSWCWSSTGSRHLVVVNLADKTAQARVRLPSGDLAGRAWELTDMLDGRRFKRDGGALAAEGLYVALDPWASHFIAFDG